jgi:hypothetical protein
MFSMNLESLLPLPTLLRGVAPVPAPAGSEMALGGAISSSSGAPLVLFVRILPAKASSPAASSLMEDPLILPYPTVPVTPGAGATALVPLLSPGLLEATTGALALPARATSLMLVLLSSLRLVMLPVPSGCRRLSRWPPRNPPGALPLLASAGLALLPEMDFARGL